MNLKKEDYTDPKCYCEKDMYLKEPPVHQIPISRVLSKLDELYSHNNFKEAISVINYWIAEAQNQRDLRGVFSLKNELMGIHRKLGNETEAITAAKEALELAEKLDDNQSPSIATCYVNSATVYKAFGKADLSMPLFEKAQHIYEKYLKSNDERLGGLYNNMALALVDLERYDEAKHYYAKAIAIMNNIPGSEPEQAISYLNLASCAEAELGLAEAEKEIEEYITLAWYLLNKEDLNRDGNYAFVCDKCSSVFGYYGFFMYEEELKERATGIYERA